MTIVSFTVVGIPRPQGNKTGFVRGGKVVMTEGRDATARANFKSWRADLANAAAAVAPPEPFDGPVEVNLWFRFLPVVSDPYRSCHVSSPDVDKLARSVLDALKVGRVVVDDSRVFELSALKRYCEPGEAPGVDVVVSDRSDIEAHSRATKQAVAKAARERVAKAARKAVAR